MADARPHGEVVHRMPHRVRLRLHVADDGQAAFERIARELAQLPSVRAVRATARTGSLLIEHDGEFEPLLDVARAWVDFAPPQPHAPMRRLQRALERAALRPTHDEQNAHLSSVTFLALLGASVYQAARGEFLPAGLPLLGYALRVMDWAAAREPE
jgi:hypothetical protein